MVKCISPFSFLFFSLKGESRYICYGMNYRMQSYARALHLKSLLHMLKFEQNSSRWPTFLNISNKYWYSFSKFWMKFGDIEMVKDGAILAF